VVRCADAFHIVAWAGDALELVRRQTWNTARKAGMSVHARDLKGARYAPRKNPDRLTDRQQAKLAWVAGQLPALPGLPAQGAAARGLRPQGRGRQGSAGPLAELGPPLPHPGLRRTRPADRQTPGAAIDATLEHRLSNGLVESTNTKIRLLTRMAFGFKSPDAMIALAMLNLGGYCPPLPDRQAA